MLKEDTEDLIVGLGELKNSWKRQKKQVFPTMQITKQARNERGQKLNRSSGKKRMRCTSPVRRGGIHN